jgi:surfactin synthase thioesterase subunit
VLRKPSDEASFRLFCFPYSGCGASMFRDWPHRIGPVEVLPLQLPGRENRIREPHFETYERLAVDLVGELGPYLDRPYGVFGHCGGALPAFETVLRIEESGLRVPARCFVSSQVAPQDGPYGRFLGLGADQLRAELVGLLAALGSRNPPDEMVDLFLEVLEADLEANRRYHKAVVARLSCPVTAIGWDEDVEVPPALMHGWAAWSKVDKKILAGHHYSFLQAPEPLQKLLRVGLAEI